MNLTYKLIIFLLLLPTVVASPLYYSSFNTIEVNQSATLHIIKESNDFILADLNTDVFFFPRATDMQESVIRITDPESTNPEDYLHFSWRDIRDDEVSFNIRSTVRVNTNYPKIKNRVTFPIATIPEEYEKFLLSSEKIDVLDPEIVEQAEKLTRGENDLFRVTSKIGAWVQQNIEYDLSTLTAEATQTASWVLENKQGVCDELSVLFMAMLRSQRIPARFVSGVAYTESELFPEGWGAHGWTEVFFPGYGWVPYDVTYGEFGWIDPTHVVFQHSTTPVKPSTEYSWKGRDVKIRASQMDIDAAVIKKGPEEGPTITLKAEVLKNKINTNSANLVVATIKNLKDYYVTETITLGKINELLVRENNQRAVTLAPGGEKLIFWTLELDPTLNKDFVYTFPITVYSNYVNKTTFFSASEEYKQYNLSEVKEISERLRTPSAQTIDLSCNPIKAVMYAFENNSISCTITTPTPFTGQICLDNDCKNMDIKDVAKTNFIVPSVDDGVHIFLVTLKDAMVQAVAQVKVDVLGAPEVRITNINLPQRVRYNDEFVLNFIAVPVSSAVYNATLRVKLNNNRLEQSLPTFTNPQEISIKLLGKNLRPGKNTITIEMEFTDEQNNKYSDKEKAGIELIDTTITQKIILFFTHLF